MSGKSSKTICERKSRRRVRPTKKTTRSGRISSLLLSRPSRKSSSSASIPLVKIANSQMRRSVSRWRPSKPTGRLGKIANLQVSLVTVIASSP